MGSITDFDYITMNEHSFTVKCFVYISNICHNKG